MSARDTNCKSKALKVFAYGLRKDNDFLPFVWGISVHGKVQMPQKKGGCFWFVHDTHFQSLPARMEYLDPHTVSASNDDAPTFSERNNISYPTIEIVRIV
jgi:hypothetical protein